jgi:hypothetical protein
LIGKAIFIGKDDDRTRVVYQVYLGGGVFEDRNAEPIVTLFGTFFLDTDKAGTPSENLFRELLLHRKNHF